MAATLFAVRPPALFQFAGTTYIGLVGRTYNQITESYVQNRITRAGVLSGMRVIASINARSTSTTIRLRKNGANGNQTVSFGAGVTGVQEDLLNTDTVAVGDKVSVSVALGSGTGNFALALVQLTFTDDAGATSCLYVMSQPAQNYTTNGTQYTGFHGGPTSSFNYAYANSAPFDAGWRFYARSAGVFRDFRVAVPVNTSNGVCTATLVKNGSDTAVVISIPAGTSGDFLDETNDVTVAVGDEFYWKFGMSGRSSGTLRIGGYEATFVSDTEDWTLHQNIAFGLASSAVGPSGANLSVYSWAGYPDNSTTEYAVKLPADAAVSRLRAFGDNIGGATDPTNLYVRANGVRGSTTVSFTTAGAVDQELSDDVNVTNFTAGDLLSFEQYCAAPVSNINGAFRIAVNIGSGAADGGGSGDVGTISLSPPTGEGSSNGAGTGTVGTITLSPPAAEAASDGAGSGDVGTINLISPSVQEVRVSQAGLNVVGSGDADAAVTQFGNNIVALTGVNARITQMGLLVLAKGGDLPIQPDPLKLQNGGRKQLLRQRLLNMYVETTPEGPVGTARFQRPGLYTVATRGGGPGRATFLWRGFRFTVSGTSVWRDAVNIGTVPGDGPVRWAISDEEIVLVVSGRAYYVTLDDVSRINDPDLPRVSDVIYCAGRFVYFTEGREGTYYYSDLGDARTIDGLSFASAEARSDPIIGAAIQGEGFAIFGTDTTEWHYPTNDPNNPFQRSQGRTYDTGCLSVRTVVLSDNTLFFVGDDRIVYRAMQVPQRVSIHSVEDYLRKQTEEQFAMNSAYEVTFGGHTFYVLNIEGQGTWALNVAQNTWAEWKSWGRDRFRVEYADPDGFMLDAYSGRIMGFDGDRCVDIDDEPIERVVSTFQQLRSGTLRNFSLALHCQQGVGLLEGYGSDPKVEMRFSDALGENWSDWMEAPLGMRGDRTKGALAQWTNLGTFPSPGRAFEFRCTDPVPFTPYMVSFNEWRP